METLKTDLTIIGGGPGGYVAAIRSAQLGRKTVLIESDTVGGVCLNRGCIPSKAIIHAADIYESFQTASKIGITASDVVVDWGKVMGWKSRVVKKLTMGVAKLLEGNGVTVIKGCGRYIDSNKILVQTESGDLEIQTNRSIIATGSRSVQIPPLPFDGQTVISSTDALSLEAIPGRMVVVGGGVIGLELGMAYAKFGTAVTIVEMLDSLLPGIPADLLEPVMKKMKRLKMKFHTGARAGGCITTNGVGSLEVTTAQDETIHIEAEKILVTVGRRPNTQDLGLENTGVVLDNSGFVIVDEKLMTRDDAIFAVGDVTGPPLLAHRASAQGLTAAATASGSKDIYNPLAMPAVVYTDPEIASVGLTEQSAGEKGIKVRVGVYPFAGHGRSSTMDKLDGFVKVLADAQTEKILGMQIVGANAGDLIMEGALAIENGLSAHDVIKTIHPHPTCSEAVAEATESALGKAIHLLIR